MEKRDRARSALWNLTVVIASNIWRDDFYACYHAIVFFFWINQKFWHFPRSCITVLSFLKWNYDSPRKLVINHGKGEAHFPHLTKLRAYDNLFSHCVLLLPQHDISNPICICEQHHHYIFCKLYKYLQDAPNPETHMFLISSCSCLYPIHWCRVLYR